jgi:threonyl-tRNA synthetase
MRALPETAGHGPSTENGFFYDFLPSASVYSETWKRSRRRCGTGQQNLPYARVSPRQEGLEKFKGEGDFTKCHFIEQFTKPDEKISIYKTGKFLTSAAVTYSFDWKDRAFSC